MSESHTTDVQIINVWYWETFSRNHSKSLKIDPRVLQKPFPGDLRAWGKDSDATVPRESFAPRSRPIPAQKPCESARFGSISTLEAVWAQRRPNAAMGSSIVK